jgi:hypothetical protein
MATRSNLMGGDVALTAQSPRTLCAALAAGVSGTPQVFTSRSHRKITSEETAGQVLPGASAKA